MGNATPGGAGQIGTLRPGWPLGRRPGSHAGGTPGVPLRATVLDARPLEVAREDADLAGSTIVLQTFSRSGREF